ncbi:hypothetical protein RJ639_040046 [Escallonia herrerae]|uniref:GH10 domain-containing protein n=1 Tax=Escallonia herrerae TaxID=1293975 RepID=A0AA88WJT7_9ASTE|nr:hypothetical protein RJ639_040046 [Escallonia herrerae]
MKDYPSSDFLLLLLFVSSSLAFTYADGPPYDYSAYTEVTNYAETWYICSVSCALISLVYNFKACDKYHSGYNNDSTMRLGQNKWYRFISTHKGNPDDRTHDTQLHRDCAGEAGMLVVSQRIKQFKNDLIDLLLQHSDDTEIDIAVTSASLQPFSEQQWRFNQQYSINTVGTTTTYICKKAVIKYKLTLVQKRKRAVTIHVSDRQGGRLQGAAVTVEQVSRDFPFGSAIAKTIIGNLPYQNWFVKRFNAAVFENELKWYATEPKPGQINYTFADQMLEFVRANQISARGYLLGGSTERRLLTPICEWDNAGTALHPYGCYQMCLTDNDFHNLPAGDTVDKLLNEWQTGIVEDQTDEQGSYSFYGFLGEYKVTTKYGNRTGTPYSKQTKSMKDLTSSAFLLLLFIGPSSASTYGSLSLCLPPAPPPKQTPTYNYVQCALIEFSYVFLSSVLQMGHYTTILLTLSDIFFPAATHKTLLNSEVTNNAPVGWTKINGTASALIRASLRTEDTTLNGIGTVIAKQGCWSFLKGGFVLNSPSNFSVLYFQHSDDRDVNVAVTSASLQPFTKQQWRFNQQYKINTVNTRRSFLFLANKKADSIQLGIFFIFLANKKADSIQLGIFSGKLSSVQERKRAATIHVSDRQGERLQGAAITLEQVSKGFPFGSTIANTIIGNVPYQQYMKTNSSGLDLMPRYELAHEIDPLATLFMNEFNVVETCGDVNSTVDTYISKIRDLKQGGVSMDGIALEGHFTVPNLPLMRAILDKLATLKLPIWLTEIDISNKLDAETQATYLEEVLREGFSHPSVNGMMLWTALHRYGCYQMCLTDNDLKNLPAGDTVDKLLNEWQTGFIADQTDEQGSYSFFGFLGEYNVTAKYDYDDDGLLYDYSAYTEPLMLIVPDVQDVYTLLQTDIIVQLSELETLLTVQHLPSFRIIRAVKGLDDFALAVLNI